MSNEQALKHERLVPCILLLCTYTLGDLTSQPSTHLLQVWHMIMKEGDFATVHVSDCKLVIGHSSEWVQSPGPQSHIVIHRHYQSCISRQAADNKWVSDHQS